MRYWLLLGPSCIVFCCPKRTREGKGGCICFYGSFRVWFVYALVVALSILLVCLCSKEGSCNEREEGRMYMLLWIYLRYNVLLLVERHYGLPLFGANLFVFYSVCF